LLQQLLQLQRFRPIDDTRAAGINQAAVAATLAIIIIIIIIIIVIRS